jgi:hypothetical protein
MEFAKAKLPKLTAEPCAAFMSITLLLFVSVPLNVP